MEQRCRKRECSHEAGTCSSDESTALPSLATRSSLSGNIPTSTILEHIKRKRALPEEETQVEDVPVFENTQLEGLAIRGDDTSCITSIC